ncbi:MAG: nicotinate-nucleotide adenylyltransferase [Gammaproteobacteria bacterium]
MNKIKQGIGILGGTFDPVHLGHLHLAKNVLEKLNLSEIRFIPCFKSAYNKKIIASPEQRLAMLKLATATEKCFLVDDCEIKRGGISYTFDTLTKLRTEFPNTPLYLTIGMDTFQQLPTWYRWKDILSLSHLVIADRPNTQEIQNPDLKSLLIKHSLQNLAKLQSSPASGILQLAINPLPISSTDIRQALAKKENVANLLPPAVYHYIIEQNLYKKLCV